MLTPSLRVPLFYMAIRGSAEQWASANLFAAKQSTWCMSCILPPVSGKPFAVQTGCTMGCFVLVDGPFVHGGRGRKVRCAMGSTCQFAATRLTCRWIQLEC